MKKEKLTADKIAKSGMEGTFLIASFLIQKKQFRLLNFIKEVTSNTINLRLLGFYSVEGGAIKGRKKAVSLNQTLDKIDIYFSFKINNANTIAYIRFYDASIEYFRMDFITSHYDLAEKNSPRINEKNILTFLNISKKVYKLCMPLYGLIGEEDFVPSPSSVINKNKYLPDFWGFYSKRIVDILGYNNLKKALKGAYIFEKIEKGGLFFALDRWTSKQPNEKIAHLQRRLHKLLDSINPKLFFKLRH